MKAFLIVLLLLGICWGWSSDRGFMNTGKEETQTESFPKEKHEITNISSTTDISKLHIINSVKNSEKPTENDLKIKYQGNILDIIPIKKSDYNGSFILLKFVTDNDLAGDIHYCLYSYVNKELLFLTDVTTFTGKQEYSGWLNDNTLYIINSSCLITYKTNGDKNTIINATLPNEAIHGAALSKSGDLAIFYCDGKSDDIKLFISKNNLESIKEVSIVDKQQTISGSEAFPMQKSILSWDNSSSFLAYTVSHKYQGYIYNFKNKKSYKLNDDLIMVKDIKWSYENNLFEFSFSDAPSRYINPLHYNS